MKCKGGTANVATSNVGRSVPSWRGKCPACRGWVRLENPRWVVVRGALHVFVADTVPHERWNKRDPQ